MFSMKAHQLSIVLPSKSRLVQLLIHTCYNEDLFFSLMLRVIFPKSLTAGQLHYSDVMIFFDVYIICYLFLNL